MSSNKSGGASAAPAGPSTAMQQIAAGTDSNAPSASDLNVNAQRGDESSPRSGASITDAAGSGLSSGGMGNTEKSLTHNIGGDGINLGFGGEGIRIFPSGPSAFGADNNVLDVFDGTFIGQGNINALSGLGSFTAVGSTEARSAGNLAGIAGEISAIQNPGTSH